MAVLDQAVNVGLFTKAVKNNVLAEVDGRPDLTRGVAYYLMDQAFYNYKLSDGKTVYTKYHDKTAPTLSVSASPSETREQYLTVACTVSDNLGTAAVYINDVKATYESANKFTGTVQLSPSINTLNVKALDFAGNETVLSFTVNLLPPVDLPTGLRQ